MKAYVDRETCIGCGLCASICPEVFQMDEDNKAIVIVDEVTSDAVECAKEAEGNCPVDAIQVG